MAPESTNRAWHLSRVLFDQRGVVSTEAMIILPVLLLLWAACHVFYEASRERLSALAEARSRASARGRPLAEPPRMHVIAVPE